MSERFQVGDIVECVDASATPFGWPPPLVEGGLYTVGWISHDGDGVLLAEVDPDPPFREFWAWRFRKVHRPRAEFLSELLTVPVLQREDA